ncbi:MAG TPA: protease modulator HflC [Steroidobacteraceae bacterium]|nr:protease modulator HflC [Steroidobacteraceae bacterium]
MSTRVVVMVVAVAGLLLAALTSLFTVSETQLALRTEFGAIVGTAYKPGLHWKLPWDQVVKFDRRILTRRPPTESFLTNDNRALTVDFYIKWRVKDPTVYYEATGGDETSAGDRVSDIVTDGIKSVVAQRTVEQIVASERAAVTADMFGSASRAVSALGIQLIDVRVERIDLPEEVADRVYEKMKQDFAKIANRLRAEGDSTATGIRAGADRERTEIISNAQRDALRIKGAADAQAADIYARAYSSNPDFYAFYRSLQAYERSLGQPNDVLVLSPDSEFFKYMKDPGSARK